MNDEHQYYPPDEPEYSGDAEQPYDESQSYSEVDAVDAKLTYEAADESVNTFEPMDAEISASDVFEATDPTDDHRPMTMTALIRKYGDVNDDPSLEDEIIGDEIIEAPEPLGDIRATDDEIALVNAMDYGVVMPPTRDDLAAAAELVQTQDDAPTAPNLLEQVLDFFGIRPDPTRRLYSLTHAITVAPDAMVNYVLRGELYLQRKQYELAADDFVKALELAEHELTVDDGKSLGLIAQGIQDRALTGYEDALRYANRVK